MEELCRSHALVVSVPTHKWSESTELQTSMLLKLLLREVRCFLCLNYLVVHNNNIDTDKRKKLAMLCFRCEEVCVYISC